MSLPDIADGMDDWYRLSDITNDVMKEIEAKRNTLHLTLPFSILVADNRRVGVFKGRVILSRQYRNAKGDVALLATAQTRGDRPIFNGGVQLVATLYEPDNRRRDPGNYRKLITDALEGIVYHDDKQIVSETWKRGGVDKESPRIEIELRAA